MSRAPWRTHNNRDVFYPSKQLSSVESVSSSSRLPQASHRIERHPSTCVLGDNRKSWNETYPNIGVRSQESGNKNLYNTGRNDSGYAYSTQSSKVVEQWSNCSPKQPSTFCVPSSNYGVPVDQQQEVAQCIHDGKVHQRYSGFDSNGPLLKKNASTTKRYVEPEKQMLNTHPNSGTNAVQQLLKLLTSNASGLTQPSMSAKISIPSSKQTERSNTVLNIPSSPSSQRFASNQYDTYAESNKGSNLAELLSRLQDKRGTEQTGSSDYSSIETQRSMYRVPNQFSEGGSAEGIRSNCNTMFRHSGNSRPCHDVPRDNVVSEIDPEKMHSFNSSNYNEPPSYNLGIPRYYVGQHPSNTYPEDAHVLRSYQNKITLPEAHQQPSSNLPCQSQSVEFQQSQPSHYRHEQNRKMSRVQQPQQHQSSQGLSYPPQVKPLHRQTQAPHDQHLHQSPFSSLESSSCEQNVSSGFQEMTSSNEASQQLHLNSQLQSILSRLSKETVRPPEQNHLAGIHLDYHNSSKEYHRLGEVSGGYMLPPQSTESRNYGDFTRDSNSSQLKPSNNRTELMDGFGVEFPKVSSVAPNRVSNAPVRVNDSNIHSDFRNSDYRRFPFPNSEPWQTFQQGHDRFSGKCQRRESSSIEPGRPKEPNHYSSLKRFVAVGESSYNTGFFRARSRESERTRWGEHERRPFLTHGGGHTGSRSSVSSYYGKRGFSGRRDVLQSYNFPPRQASLPIMSEGPFTNRPGNRAEVHREREKESLKVTRVSGFRHGNLLTTKHPKISRDSMRTSPFCSSSSSHKTSRVGSIHVSRPPSSMTNKGLTLSHKDHNLKCRVKSPRNSYNTRRSPSRIVSRQADGGQGYGSRPSDGVQGIGITKVRKRPLRSLVNVAQSGREQSTVVCSAVICYNDQFQKYTEELSTRTISSFQEKNEQLSAALYLSSLDSFNEMEGDSVGSYKVQNNMPRLWIQSSIYYLETMWTRIRNALMNAEYTRLNERYSPCLLLTRLPNVNASALQRALSCHFKSLRLSIEKIFMPLYPETGLSMGWCILDVGSQWKSVQDILSAPQFQWRGICTHILPLPCPQLLQLNATLTVAPQRLKKHVAVNVGDWTSSRFNTCASLIYPPMISFIKSLNSKKNDESIPIPQLSYLNTRVPFMVLTSSRRLELAVPITAPNFTAQLSSLLVQNQIQSVPKTYPSRLCLHENPPEGITFPSCSILHSTSHVVEALHNNLSTEAPSHLNYSQELLKCSDTSQIQEETLSHHNKEITDEVQEKEFFTFQGNSTEANIKESSNESTVDLVAEVKAITDQCSPCTASCEKRQADVNIFSQVLVSNSAQTTDSIIHVNGMLQTFANDQDPTNIIEGDMDVSQSDDDILGTSQNLNLNPVNAHENHCSLGKTERQPSIEGLTSSNQLSSWDAFLDASLFPHNDGANVFSAVLPSSLPLTTTRSSVDQFLDKSINHSGRIVFPEFSEMNIDGESVVVKPITREDDLGFLSLFQLGNHTLLGWDLLLLFTDSLLLWPRNQTEDVSNKIALNVAAAWTSSFCNEVEGLQLHHIREMLYTIKPAAQSLLPEFEILPYLLHLSHVPNFKVHEEDFKTRLTECITTALGVPETLDETHTITDVWGPQYYVFAETNRFRGDGFVLLPSKYPLQELVTHLKIKQRTIQETPCWTMFVDVYGAHCPVEVLRALVPSVEVCLDLRIISSLLSLWTHRLGEALKQRLNEFSTMTLNPEQETSDEILGDVNEENRFSHKTLSIKVDSLVDALPSLKELLDKELKEASLEGYQNSLNKLVLEEKMGRCDIAFSHCSFRHFIETYFFSLEKFFQLPIFARLGVWSKSVETSSDNVCKRVLRVTWSLYKKLQSLCHHTLPNLFLDPKYRALGIYKQALEFSKVDLDFLDEATLLKKTEFVLPKENIDSDSASQIVQLLQSYVEANFPMSSDDDSIKRRVQHVQWLILENDPDWQATVRIQGVKCSTPSSTVENASNHDNPIPLVPFELTGEICNSALMAKACCALQCLKYFAMLEFQLLTALGVPDSNSLSEIHLVDATSEECSSTAISAKPSTTHCSINILPKPTSWDNVGHTSKNRLYLCLDHLRNQQLSLDISYWIPETLRRLQEDQHFRFIPLRHTLSTPRHRFLIAQDVQMQFRAQDKLFKWTHHNSLFEPKEDCISAALQTEHHK